ncbi:hypothetical protein ABZ401_26170 [Streptomyces sp. NPDC005892]|uniref:hypothetical protein n=1 Tax=Streptomyces sp. NPDC005892 TaxID=3155593 RepID=UPI0034019D6B
MKDSKYARLRIVTTVEIGSLPTLVTNTSGHRSRRARRSRGREGRAWRAGRPSRGCPTPVGWLATGVGRERIGGSAGRSGLWGPAGRAKGSGGPGPGPGPLRVYR